MAEEIKKEEVVSTETKPKKKKTTKKPAAPKTEPKPEPEPQKQLARGVVAFCKRLNVRSLGVMTSGVVAILNVGDSVLIDLEKSTDGWYSVKTKNGKTGFCMKKYIRIP